MASFDDITIALRTLTLTNVAQLDQELGRGSYGKVFTVKYRQKIYAAKEIHSILLETANPEEKRKIKNTFYASATTAVFLVIQISFAL